MPWGQTSNDPQIWKTRTASTTWACSSLMVHVYSLNLSSQTRAASMFSFSLYSFDSPFHCQSLPFWCPILKLRNCCKLVCPHSLLPPCPNEECIYDVWAGPRWPLSKQHTSHHRGDLVTPRTEWSNNYQGWSMSATLRCVIIWAQIREQMRHTKLKGRQVYGASLYYCWLVVFTEPRSPRS